MPVAAGNEVITTELQQSIFNALPSSVTAEVPTPVATAPAAIAPAAQRPDPGTNGDAGGLQGVKRRREDESDDEGAPMEEDDSDAPMEASSDEDSS